MLILISINFAITSCFSEKDVDSQLAGSGSQMDNEVMDETFLSEDLAAAEEDNFEEMENPNTDDMEAKLTQKEMPMMDDETDYGADIATIKKALNRGQYQKALSLAQNDDSTASQYYKGIAYFSMMQQNHIYPKETRLEYRNKAIKNLKEVSISAEDQSLKARAAIWYGIAMHLSYTNLANKKKAISSFFRFERGELKSNKYANDALYNSGMVYLQMGWYGVAKNYFKRVAKATNIDNEVFDFTSNQYLSARQASEKGLRNLRRAMAN